MDRINFQIFKENHGLAMFPPSYYDDKHKYDLTFIGTKTFNCYAYAMQLTIPVERGNGYYLPGFLSGATPKFWTYTKQTLNKSFQNDCEFLELRTEETTIDAPLKNNAYKIIVWNDFCDKSNFHFTRQNENRSWSEIPAWGFSPKIIDIFVTARKYKDKGYDSKVYYISKI